MGGESWHGGNTEPHLQEKRVKSHNVVDILLHGHLLLLLLLAAAGGSDGDRFGCATQATRDHRWQVRAVVLRPFPLVFVFFFSCPLNSTRQGSQRFDTSRKMRPPAWTDRILFAPPGPQAISPLKYTSVPGSCHSDHRPVYAKFRVRLDD